MAIDADAAAIGQVAHEFCQGPFAYTGNLGSTGRIQESFRSVNLVVVDRTSVTGCDHDRFAEFTLYRTKQRDKLRLETALARTFPKAGCSRPSGSRWPSSPAEASWIEEERLLPLAYAESKKSVS